jgi:uncharacterized repeat protein (TIGR02543 family)
MGLFGYTNGAKIYTVIVSGTSGGLVGYAQNTSIAYCINKAAVSGGGIVGQSEGNTRIEHSLNSGNITYRSYASSNYAGGIIGYSQNTDSLLYNVNIGSVSGLSYAAGIAGYGFNVRFCSNFGNVISSISVNANPVSGGGFSTINSRAEAAGIANIGTGGKIYNSYNRGDVRAQITNTHRTTGSATDWTKNTANSIAIGIGNSAYYSYNTGNVNASASRNQIINCYLSSGNYLCPSDGTNSQAGTATFARVGTSPTTSYYLNTITTSGTASGGGTTITAANLQDDAIISTLNATGNENIWAKDIHNQNNGYPVIKKKGVAFSYAGFNTFEIYSGNYNEVISAPEAQMFFKPGYSEFDKWSKEPTFATDWNFETDVLKSDTARIYAKFKPDQHIVHLNTNGGDPLASYIGFFEQTVTQPENPTRTGATFAGWYKDEALTAPWNFAADKMPNNAITLYAKWNVTVAFNANRGTVSPATQVYPADIAYGGTFPTPTRAGYTFAGWASDPTLKTSVTTASIPTANTTLYAKWEVNVKFNTHGGEAVSPLSYLGGVEFDYGTNSGLPAATKTGYVFGGWYDDLAYSGQRANADIVPNEPHTLYAKWGDLVTVTFDPQNGEAATTREYYPQRNYTSSVTYEGTAYNNYFPSNPSKPGAVFLGWYEETLTTQVTSTTIVQSNSHTLYAKWNEINTVAVNFETNGGTAADPRSYRSGYAYSATTPAGFDNNPGLPTVSKTGSVFAGWYASPNYTGSEITNTSAVNEYTTVLYAKWSETVAVTFELNGGTGTASKNYYHGFPYISSATGISGTNNAFANPTKTGFVFGGWYSDASLSSLVTSGSIVPSYPHALYAKWVESITVTFETNGGTAIAAKTYYPGFEYNASGTLAASANNGLASPTRTNYHFIGWYAEQDFSGPAITAASTVNQSTTKLYARWVGQVQATFIDYEEETEQNKNYYHDLMYSQTSTGNLNNGLPTATPSTKPGFLGWFSQISGMENKIDAASLVPNKNTVLHARWCVEVAFATNGGTAIPSRIYTPNTRYNQSPNEGLPVMLRDGYVFDGWFLDAEFVQPVNANSIVLDGAHTLYAKWTQVPTYTVAYNANGGANAPANQIKTYSVALALSSTVPAREGYEFTGWNTAANGSGTDYAPGSNYTANASVTLYAQWTLLNIPVRSAQTASAANLRIHAIGSAIILENLPANAKVKVYTLNGKQIYSANPGNPQILRIQVQTKGMYIVKTTHGSERNVLRVAVM